jgi:isoleucyl-tRNA synthetase
VSDEILKRIADSYRRMRNTVRFLLGNLDGFDPAAHAVEPSQMVALDAWAIERTRQLHEEVVAAYRSYQFHLIYQKVHNFCIVDMGGFYLDIVKDRCYTTPTNCLPRRSAQTAMYHIGEAMVRWLAPILSFTADEIWRYMPGKRSASVHLETWHPLPTMPANKIDWDALIALKSDVARELERLRGDGAIGAPLQAEVELFCTANEAPRLQALGDELRFVLITSAATVTVVADAPTDAIAATSVAKTGVWIRVRPTDKAKCVRCWHHREDVGSHSEHPELCGRCVENVVGAGETRRFA